MNTEKDRRIHSVTVPLNRLELGILNRVAARFGLSKAAAARLMMSAGALTYDPAADPEKRTP